MVGQDQAKVVISDLKAGTYEMKLTVTDDKHLQGSDTVKIHVKKGIVVEQRSGVFVAHFEHISWNKKMLARF